MTGERSPHPPRPTCRSPSLASTSPAASSRWSGSRTRWPREAMPCDSSSRTMPPRRPHHPDRRSTPSREQRPAWLPMPVEKLDPPRCDWRCIATARADVCLANYFTTAYVALASKWLRRRPGGPRVQRPWLRAAQPRPATPTPACRAGSSGPRSAWLSYRLPLQKICTTDWLPRADAATARPTSSGTASTWTCSAHRPRDHRASAWSSGRSGGWARRRGTRTSCARSICFRPICRSRSGSRRRTRSPSRTRFPLPSSTPAPSARWPSSTPAATCSSSRRAARGSGCRPWRRWRLAARSSRRTPAGCASSRRTARTALMVPPADAPALARRHRSSGPGPRPPRGLARRPASPPPPATARTPSSTASAATSSAAPTLERRARAARQRASRLLVRPRAAPATDRARAVAWSVSRKRGACVVSEYFSSTVAAACLAHLPPKLRVLDQQRQLLDPLLGRRGQQPVLAVLDDVGRHADRRADRRDAARHVQQRLERRTCRASTRCPASA